MFHIREETKRKILEAIFVIDDTHCKKDRYKELYIKSNNETIIKKIITIFVN